MSEQTTKKTKSQSVRFRDTTVQIQTTILNGTECLCLEDVQRRFPSVTTLCVDCVQLTFARDTNGIQMMPLRIEAPTDRIVDALEPEGQSNDGLSTFFTHMDAKMQAMDKKTDLILANTQETLIRIKHVMTQMYELHEYTTPRYFFILPVKSDTRWTSLGTVQNWFQLHYKLYFLCECSDEPDKLHIAPHDGYSIKKPSEFVAYYGSYLRTTLNITRRLLSIGGFVIPQSGNLSAVVANTLPSFTKESTNYTDVDNKLNVVERVLNQTNSNGLTRLDPSVIRKVALPDTPLQGAQLRELEVFLDITDDKNSLGNLYRTITDDGHVRWVCLEHYNAIDFNTKMLEYVRQLEMIGGRFNPETKEAILTGNLTTKNITTFCEALAKGFNVLILRIQNCSLDMNDLDKLFYTIINRSSIHLLVMNTIEVGKWMRTSKYRCDNMTISLKNQLLKVQFSNHCHDESTKILVRLLRQNKICRTFDLSGYDLSIHDRYLLGDLKKNPDLTALVINHFMNIEFVNAIVTSNSALRRLKLSFWFNTSSTLFSLCQAIGQNNTLTDLDIIDHTCLDDKDATNELLKVLREHKSIKHVHLHVFDVRPSSENEICLIHSLLHNSFISHLRISQSSISEALIATLIHASEERRFLVYLEFYNCQIDENSIDKLQILYSNGTLTHLIISKEQYSSVVLMEKREQLLNGECVIYAIAFSSFVLEFPYHQNTKLEQKIALCYVRSSICLDDLGLIDQDMKIVVREALVSRECNFLSLRSNKITSLGASILADTLTHNKILETLDLGDNYLSDDGVESLTNVLSTSNSTLKTLILQKNRMTDRGAKHLAQMLKVNRTLTWLYIGDNEIGDLGIQFLANTIEHENQTLELLVLSSNKLLTDASIDDLLRMIEHHPSLKKLWTDSCSLSEDGKQRLGKIQQSKIDFYVRT